MNAILGVVSVTIVTVVTATALLRKRNARAHKTGMGKDGKCGRLNKSHKSTFMPISNSRSCTVPLIVFSVLLGVICVETTDKRWAKWIPDKWKPEGRTGFHCDPISLLQREILIGSNDGWQLPIFTNSSRSQRHFEQGLLFRWGFNIAEAEKSFEIAHKLGPDCAMCLWGRAYARTPHLNVLPGPLDANYPSFTDEDLKVARGFALWALKVAKVNRENGPQDRLKEKEVKYIEALLSALPDATLTPEEMVQAALISAGKWLEIWHSDMEDVNAGVLAAENILTLYSWNIFDPTGEPTSHQILSSLSWGEVWAEALSLTAGQDMANMSFPTDMSIDIGDLFHSFPLPNDMQNKRVGYPYMRKGARIVEEILLQVLSKDPMHLLALHLHIHLTEAAPPGDLDKGAVQSLSFANNLVSSAPRVGHLLHMPSHTFFRTGMYKEAVESNIHAYDLDVLHGASCVSAYAPEHNLAVLVSAASMCGMYDVAVKYAGLMRQVPQNLPGPSHTRGDEYETLLFVLLRFGQWAAIQNQTPPGATSRGSAPDGGPEYTIVLWNFAKLIMATHRDPIPSRRLLMDDSTSHHILQDHLVRLERLAADIPHTLCSGCGMGSGIYIAPYREIGQILVLLAKAKLSFIQGDKGSAISFLQQAVEGEDALGFNEPRKLHLPMRQCLGWLLVLYQEWELAANVFRQDLSEVPKNPWSIHGLAKTYEGWKGPHSSLTQHYVKLFQETWKGETHTHLHSSCPMLFD